jgi:hypothetical protein
MYAKCSFLFTFTLFYSWLVLALAPFGTWDIHELGTGFSSDSCSFFTLGLGLLPRFV